MKKSIFYLYLLSMSLVLSHASLPDKNKVKSRVEKKDTSFLHEMRSMGRKISNMRLSRGYFSLLHIGIYIITYFLLLYFTNGRGYSLVEKIVFFVLPLLDAFFLYLRGNDTDFPIRWYTSQLILPFLYFLFLLCQTLVFYEVDSMQDFFKALIYEEGSFFQLNVKTKKNLRENIYFYLNRKEPLFYLLFFLIHFIGLLLPIIGPMWYPSILDKKEKKTSLDDLSPENKEESKLSNPSSLSPSDRVTGENDSENQP